MNRRSFAILFICAILGGILFLGFGGYRMYQDKKEIKLKLALQELIKAESFLRKEETNSCLIKNETTKITYFHYIDCGPEVTVVELYPEHLVWEYHECRHDCCLIDSCKYEKTVFDKLINQLSAIEFSVSSIPSNIDGGEEFRYSFEINSKCYLSYNEKESNYLLGDYKKVGDIIQQFIKSHKTKCEALFEMYSKMPHERAFIGEFQELPKELERYKVK